MSAEAHHLKSQPGQKPVPVAPFWAVALAIWVMLLWVLPDPRPLAAPEWAVQRAQTWGNVSEPTARAVATFLFRAAGIAVLGILLSLALSRLPKGPAALLTLIGAPFLAVVVKWLNFGYLPIAPQLIFIVAVAVVGALAGLAVRRSRVALVALGLFTAALFAWGTFTRITDDLYEAARVTGQHVIERFSQIPADADRFVRLTELAFAYAEDNSHGVDPVFPNQAAILALGVILGDDQVAEVARREVYRGRAGEREALRRRVRVHGRGDLSQHFWVSAALTVLSDPGRALTVGIAKEMKDSTPGGSGFSFVDMLANKAGIRFAVIATQDADSARDLQLRLAKGVGTADLFPSIHGLPEGLSQDEFHSQFGGLGGAETRRLFTEIERRIAALPGLQRLP
jgi:hypothetical protein